MDKIKNNSKSCLAPDEVIALSKNIDTDSGFLPIDQSYGLKSNINPATGFPFTDVQLVMRANTLSERNRLMDNLQVAPPDFIDDAKSDESVVSDMPNSRDQMPSEVIDYQQKELQGKIAEHNEEVSENERSALFEKFVDNVSSSDNSKSDKNE